MAKSIAVISAVGLGDGLITLVISHNLQAQGYTVTTYHSPLMQLQSWFPDKNIKPFPKDVVTELSQYDEIISLDTAPTAAFCQQIKHYKLFTESDFDWNKTLVSNFSRLSQGDKDNGIVVPTSLQRQKYKNRVVIHPVSTEEKRTWPAEKFIRLAKRLKNKNFDPVFVMAPEERQAWLHVESLGFSVPEFPSLSDLAAFVAESGYMIGNNSGVGHLASNLGVPSVSLFAKKSYAVLWRPGWGKNKVVTPTFAPPSGNLRNKYWKQWLTVGKVYRAFRKLAAETSK